MCGIAGALSLDGSPVPAALLNDMRDIMSHRGPDGAGSWISPDRRIALAHRRLSIIDLSAAADQPMSNDDGSIWIVFNGEIYNHAELRAELERTASYRWKTDHSDTEMIIHAYEHWGIDCIQRFRGMFAIALWDGRARRLWLVRDRIGIKPIYYVRTPRRLMFASEIKALLLDPDVPRRVNQEALYHYLSFLTSPAPQTLFAGIYKVPPATRMAIDADGSVTEQRYWDPWDAATPLVNASEEEIAERVLSELRTSVKYRKVSDVPVGVFLSGGIDSSTNTALFSDGTGPVKTFTIGYDTEYPSYASEVDYARQMAELVGAEHYVRRLSLDDLISFVPDMVYHQDEPIGDVVCVPLYYISKLAREQGVTVCQVGEGADELFCGYPSWKAHLRVARLNELPVPRFAKRALLAGLDIAGYSEGYPYECLRRAVSGSPLFFGGAEGLTHVEKHRLLGPDLRARFEGYSSAEALRPIHARFLEKSWEPSAFHWMTYLDLNLRLPELLLMRVDKMTMATALEGRVPFLDHKFVELALSIPTAVKLKNGELKHVLKRAVRGVIPDYLIDRPKQGFGVPMQEWFMSGLADRIKSEVTRFSERTGLLDPREVRRYVDAGKGSKVWQLYNLALWYDRFIERPVTLRTQDTTYGGTAARGLTCLTP
jgi:asparagine synthase (glutamine-hydrolysing)